MGKFTITEIKEQPNRTYTKASKYDEVLDSFAESKLPLAKIKMLDDETGKDYDSNYLVTQFKKRFNVTGDLYGLMYAKTVNGETYLFYETPEQRNKRLNKKK